MCALQILPNNSDKILLRNYYFHFIWTNQIPRKFTGVIWPKMSITLQNFLYFNREWSHDRRSSRLNNKRTKPYMYDLYCCQRIYLVECQKKYVLRSRDLPFCNRMSLINIYVTHANTHHSH